MIDLLYAFVTHPFWYALGSVAAVVGMCTALWFVVRFQLETGNGWRVTPFGRFLMSRKLLIATLFAVVLINRYIGGDLWVRRHSASWAGADMLVSLLMLAFAIQTYVPYRLLVQVQKDHQHQVTDRAEIEDRRTVDGL